MKKSLTIKLGQVADYEIRLLKVFRSVVESGGFAALLRARTLIFLTWSPR
jgi:hypothetical protein